MSLETVRVERIVKGRSAQEAFAFVLDVESYERFMPNVKKVTVREADEQKRITHWETTIEGAPLVWTERDDIRQDDLRIDFAKTEGDFSIFRGHWEVRASDGGVTLAFELEYSIGIPLIEPIVGPILKKKITENLAIMLDSLVVGIEGA